MSSYRQILYHLIFGTKNHLNVLPKAHHSELYMYITGIMRNKNCILYGINGIENHIHILFDLHPSIALADLVKDVKVASSMWLKQKGNFPDFTAWAEGYCAFTYAYRDKEMILNYIKNQEEHHKKKNFREECIGLLKENGVDYDERYPI